LIFFQDEVNQVLTTQVWLEQVTYAVLTYLTKVATVHNVCI